MNGQREAARDDTASTQWVVALWQSYYPSVEPFDTEEQAREAYQSALEDVSEDHAELYLARVVRRTDFHDEAHRPEVVGGGWVGYCDWCRPK